MKLFDIGKTPDWWLMQAYMARKAAERLWSGHHEPRSEEEYEFYVIMGSTMYTPALFFAGVELELYLKAMAICGIDLAAEAVEWKSKIFAPSHDLVKLCDIVKIELSRQERKTCKSLSMYIKWMGRYPIPKSEAEYRRRILMEQEDIWSGYLATRDRLKGAADKCCDHRQRELLDHYVFRERRVASP